MSAPKCRNVRQADDCIVCMLTDDRRLSRCVKHGTG